MSAEEEAEDWEEEGEELIAAPGTSLVPGVLASLPWLFVYEWALVEPGANQRSGAAVYLFAPLRALGEDATLVRRALLLALLPIGLWVARRRGWSVAPTLLRCLCEGAVLALVLGPLLFGLGELLGLDLPQASFGREPRGSLPPLWLAAWVGGSAAYEELLFRVGVLGLCFLAGKRLTLKLGGSERMARIVAELAGAVLSSLAFAAFHLGVVLSFLGTGGEDWDPARFAWRVLWGLALALVFRLRGLGVCVWTHALFNVALLVGAGPGVLSS